MKTSKKVEAVIVTIVIVIIILVGIYAIENRITVVWRDNGHVKDLIEYPVPLSPPGIGDHLLQKMIIVTTQHGDILFDTANMCNTDIVFGYSCRSGTVGWTNGTWVFVYHLSNDGNYVGALNP